MRRNPLDCNRVCDVGRRHCRVMAVAAMAATSCFPPGGTLGTCADLPSVIHCECPFGDCIITVSGQCGVCVGGSSAGLPCTFNCPRLNECGAPLVTVMPSPTLTPTRPMAAPTFTPTPAPQSGGGGSGCSIESLGGSGVVLLLLGFVIAFTYRRAAGGWT